MVDRQSGHLYVAVSLDYDDPERPSTYTLTLLAVDSGQSPLTGSVVFLKLNIYINMYMLIFCRAPK